MKVLLVLVDGMRPDALQNIPEAESMLAVSSHTLHARTVMPSVTLPCHMSLFHSVGPERHGTTTNTYAPQVRPVKGLCEVLAESGKKCAFFYNWEPLRDLARPCSLTYSYFCSGILTDLAASNEWVTEKVIQCLKSHEIDFGFVYLGNVDEVGHRCGWMGEEYIAAVRDSWKNIAQLQAAFPEYHIIVTADHGGHGRSHGTDMPEDMTIPLFLLGETFTPDSPLENASIIDIAPTTTKLFGIQPDSDWEGKPLI